MTGGERKALAWVSMLLEYPEQDFFLQLDQIRNAIREDFPHPEGLKTRQILLDFLERVERSGEVAAQENYVGVFDHDPAASLHMTWHRYGNDRSQGKAMAALNGLYRQAGFEPGGNSMPDYLPRMLEFMSAADDWAVETMLDGFGPELAGLCKHVSKLDCPHDQLLELAVGTLRKKWPEHFRPRTGVDPTARPMANPEMEMHLMEPHWKKA